MNSNFDQALTTGQAIVRKWWVNKNNSSQIGVQFQQEIPSPSSANILVTMAQGIRPVQKVTAIHSFNSEVAQAFLGSSEGDFLESTPKLASELFQGMEVNIQVTENFTPNPYSSSHEPKINPGTGEVVTGYDETTGKNMPVYRHTELVLGEAKHSFAPQAKEVTSVNINDLLTR